MAYLKIVKKNGQEIVTNWPAMGSERPLESPHFKFSEKTASSFLRINSEVLTEISSYIPKKHKPGNGIDLFEALGLKEKSNFYHGQWVNQLIFSLVIEDTIEELRDSIDYVVVSDFDIYQSMLVDRLIDLFPDIRFDAKPSKAAFLHMFNFFGFQIRLIYGFFKTLIWVIFVKLLSKPSRNLEMRRDLFISYRGISDLNSILSEDRFFGPIFRDDSSYDMANSSLVSIFFDQKKICRDLSIAFSDKSRSLLFEDFFCLREFLHTICYLLAQKRLVLNHKPVNASRFAIYYYKIIERFGAADLIIKASFAQSCLSTLLRDSSINRVFYLFENQPWEMSLLRICEKSNIKTLGCVHSVFRLGDLRYSGFKDLCNGVNINRVPDRILVNSVSAKNHFCSELDNEDGAFLVEPHRMAFHALPQKSSCEFSSNRHLNYGDLQNIGVLGDISRATNRAVLGWLKDNRLSFGMMLSVTFRPHPSDKSFDPIKYEPSLDYLNIRSSFVEMASSLDLLVICGGSSVVIDVLLANGRPLIVIPSFGLNPWIGSPLDKICVRDCDSIKPTDRIPSVQAGQVMEDFNINETFGGWEQALAGEL